MENKVTIIKQRAQKRVAASFQMPQTATLTNLDKKLKLNEDVKSESQITDVLIVEDSSTPRVTGQFDCVICNKTFKNSQGIYQHKKTGLHKQLA